VGTDRSDIVANILCVVEQKPTTGDGLIPTGVSRGILAHCFAERPNLDAALLARISEARGVSGAHLMARYSRD
jgi:hypothetical protein